MATHTIRKVVACLGLSKSLIVFYKIKLLAAISLNSTVCIWFGVLVRRNTGGMLWEVTLNVLILYYHVKSHQEVRHAKSKSSKLQFKHTFLCFYLKFKIEKLYFWPTSPDPTKGRCQKHTEGGYPKSGGLRPQLGPPPIFCSEPSHPPHLKPTSRVPPHLAKWIFLKKCVCVSRHLFLRKKRTILQCLSC